MVRREVERRAAGRCGDCRRGSPGGEDLRLRGAGQGRELLLTEGVHVLDEASAEAASAADRYLRALHAEGMPGGRLGMMYHLCGNAQEECSAGCPIDACGVEHVDIWRLTDPRDQATLEAEYHLGPHASEIAGLGRALDVPALDGRLAQLGQSLQGGSGCGPGSRAVAMNDVMPGASQALEQRAQGPTAAGSGARVSAAPAGCERAAEMLTTVLPGGVVVCVLSDEGSGVLGRDAYLGITGRRHLIQRIAKQRPGVHLGRGPAHPRRQVPHLLAGPSQAVPLSPYVTQYHNAVFYAAYPLRTVDADGVRVLHPLGEAFDGLSCGLVVEGNDLPMQEFKARAMAHRDGHCRGGRWLALIPSKSRPAGASRDGEDAAERVEVSSAVPTKQGPPSLIGARPQARRNPDQGGETALVAGVTLSASQAGQSLEFAAGGHAGAAGARDGLRMRGPVQRYRWGKLHARAERPGGQPRFGLVMMLYEAVHGAPGDVGGFVRSAPPEQRARPARMREVLPLPIPDAPGIARCSAEWLKQSTVLEAGLDAAIAAGRAVLVARSLNHQCVGHAEGSPVPTGPLTAAQGSSMRVIRRAARYVASDSAKGFQGPDWHEDVAARDDTHGGEEVTRALPLAVGGDIPVLPPCGSIAAVRVLDIVEEHVAGWSADPTMALLPKAEWPEEVQWAATQARSDAEWHRSGAELVELGLAAPIANVWIFKGGNREMARRLIINMVPASRYQRMMRDDIGAWQPYMTSVEAIPGELIGVSRAERAPLIAEKLEHAWVQYDINDGDHGEIVLVGRLDELAGSLSEVQSELRAACQRSGIQVANGKAKHRERGLEQMGADLDGMGGRVGVAVEKQLLLVTLVMVEMGQPQVTAKAVLVVLGRSVRIAEVCVPFVGFLNECGAAGQWRNPQTVASDMCGELLVFCMAATRGLADLRAKIDPGKITTDASEQ
ncbi:unnamed protein product, partial [Prorocentrum cordatum]